MVKKLGFKIGIALDIIGGLLILFYLFDKLLSFNNLPSYVGLLGISAGAIGIILVNRELFNKQIKGKK